MLFRYGIPITKAEELEDGRLLVSGVFSSETLDKTRDVVDLAATKRAVERWEAKNLREQHDPKKAVGKALDFEYDEKAGTASFSGFVSAACPDTITKVKDKVLSYFSIGAMVNKTESFKAADGQPARRIVDYDLVEISLVDNPANPDAKLKVAMAEAAGLEAPAEEPPPPAPGPAADPEPESRFGKALKAAIAATPAHAAAAPPVSVVLDEAALAALVKALEETRPAAAAPVPVKKSGEEWDISMALEILLGLKGLLFCETLEPDTEPPAQRTFLEAAIAAVQNFIASEAGELAAQPANAAEATSATDVEAGDSLEAEDMAARPSLLKTITAALAARDAAAAARFAAIEKALAEAPKPFTAAEGEELGTAIGQVLTFTKTFTPDQEAARKAAEKTEQIEKAIGELKGSIGAELKAVRDDLNVIKAQPVPGGPLARRPGVQMRSSAPPASLADSEIQVLETRLANTSDPNARAVYERDLRFARAKKGLQP